MSIINGVKKKIIRELYETIVEQKVRYTLEMNEKSWKKIFASSIWIGSILGILGFSQYILYYFYRDNEIFYYSGNFLFLSGILVLIISLIIAIATSIYFIFN